jgi:uncharacterized cupin superfamily protein
VLPGRCRAWPRAYVRARSVAPDGGEATFGEISWLVESGERIELAAGDVYSFSKGTLSRWIVHEPVTKVAVIAHSDPLAP